MQFERVQGYLADIEKEKQTVAAWGGETPTISDKPTADSRLVVEEPFGVPRPILESMAELVPSACSKSHHSLLSWSAEEEVVALADKTEWDVRAE